MSPSIRFVLASILLAGCFGDTTSDSTSAATGSGSGGGGANGNVRGAIFTTLADGSRVNANIYDAKEDVYLDGGPGMTAPSSAAALPEGDYYFQVTDPSGKQVLSSDDIACRRIHVNASGLIDVAYPGPGCQHLTGTDMDYGSLTVQLMPYADTPNNGGVYKVWVTPVAELGPEGKFRHNKSKTDNFKVRTADDEHPSCGDGTVDAGEQCDDGNIADGDGCSSTCQHEEEPPPPPPACGNGLLEAGEQCDDGNIASGDGCSAMCTTEMMPPPPPVCGNGTKEDGEECDDGNLESGDGCSSVCVMEPCEDMPHLDRLD